MIGSFTLACLGRRTFYTLLNDSMIILPELSVVMTNRYGSLLEVPSLCTKTTLGYRVAWA